jgi:cytochrome oxidase Cu insertion factor (SCO1/SenC/PrrC family)
MFSTGLLSRITIWTISAITVGIVLFFFFRSDDKVERLSEFEEPLDTLAVIGDFNLSTNLNQDFSREKLNGVITVWTFATEEIILNGQDSVLVSEVKRLQDEFAIDNSYSKENVTQIVILFTKSDSLDAEGLKEWSNSNQFVPTRVKCLTGDSQQTSDLLNLFDISANALSSQPVWYLIDPQGKIRGVAPDFGYTQWSDFNRDFARLDREYKKGR